MAESALVEARGSPGAGRVLLEVAFVVAWSSGFIGAVLGTRSADAATLLFWRFLAAAILINVWAFVVMRRRGPRLREAGLHGVIGLFSQVVYLGGVVGATQLGVGAGISALIAALQPLLASALAGPLLGEDTSPRQWFGLGVGLVGVALVVGGDMTFGSGVPRWAYALPLAGMVGLVAGTLLERRSAVSGGDELPLETSLAVQFSVSALVFGAACLFDDGNPLPPASPDFWFAVAWVVALSSFGGYGLYWLNLKVSSVGRVSSLLYLTPPTTMVWAFLMFGDGIGVFAVVGMAVCAIGVLLANRGRR